MSNIGWIVAAGLCLVFSLAFALNGAHNPGELQAADNLGEFATGLIIAAAWMRRTGQAT